MLTEICGSPLGDHLPTVIPVEELADPSLGLLGDHVHDQFTAVDPVEDLLTVGVDALALLVHHLVVFQQVLATLEVAFLDLFLRPLDSLGHHPALDRLAVLHRAVDHPHGHFGDEQPHQVVFHREEETA